MKSIKLIKKKEFNLIDFAVFVMIIVWKIIVISSQNSFAMWSKAIWHLN